MGFTHVTQIYTCVHKFHVPSFPQLCKTVEMMVHVICCIVATSTDIYNHPLVYNVCDDRFSCNYRVCKYEYFCGT